MRKVAGTGSPTIILYIYIYSSGCTRCERGRNHWNRPLSVCAKRGQQLAMASSDIRKESPSIKTCHSQTKMKAKWSNYEKQTFIRSLTHTIIRKPFIWGRDQLYASKGCSLFTSRGHVTSPHSLSWRWMDRFIGFSFFIHTYIWWWWHDIRFIVLLYSEWDWL